LQHVADWCGNLQIEHTDRQTGALVYELYGLTEECPHLATASPERPDPLPKGEGIRFVEGATGRRQENL